MIYSCPKCKKEFSQVPDNLHFHFWCEKCDKEYELDGITIWKDCYQGHDQSRSSRVSRKALVDC